ncbi:MAG: hypothetical protein E3J72_17850 [Planctomycetota bacterium]|nr:MAG: hypothetical protein E3J72_17850 [Planctomycetota bacterium]
MWLVRIRKPPPTACFSTVLTPAGTTPQAPSRRSDGLWSAGTIRDILRNPTYTGDLVWNRRASGKIHKIKNSPAVRRSEHTPYSAVIVPS